MVDNIIPNRLPTQGWRGRTLKIRQFILANVSAHPGDIAALTAERFSVSRQSASKHLQALERLGLLEATGRTRAREYRLRSFQEEEFTIENVPEAEEDVVWRQRVAPLLDGLPSNVIAICHFGFTEMFNNVIDHSESPDALITVKQNAEQLEIAILDSGVGIFNKLQQEFGLHDPRHALLELLKGKLTSDPARHTGEGIFFTSRMFDEFTIYSSDLFFARRNLKDDWFMKTEARQAFPGTVVELMITTSTTRTPQQIFDEYADIESDYTFTRTHVPVFLAQHGEELLVSRSQAKRLLARFDRFDVIVLDFKGIASIGQAFADEVFRVFAKAHPHVEIVPANMSSQVERMVRRSRPGALDALA
jgi:anti-sigma regulatory factor (Ser/Thr protein kinase)/uncharacterized protein (DUF1330 family)